MEHRGIWAAVGACLIAGALVAPPGSALSPQRLITEVLQPAAVPTASAAPATADPEVPVAVPDHPELAPVVPVLIEAAPPAVPPPTATADSISRPRTSTPPKTSAPKPPAQVPVTQPPKATPAPSSPPPASTPPIKRPDKRGNPVKPGPPVTKGAPKSDHKAGATALARTYAVTVTQPTSWYRADHSWAAKKTPARQAPSPWRAKTTCPDRQHWTGHSRTWAGKNWRGGSSHSFRVSW